MIHVFIIKLSISIYLIWLGSKNFDIAASYLSRNLPKGIKGPTINAVASSFPELLISSLFLFYYSDIIGFSAGYATIVGSAAFNITIIPALSALFYFKNNLPNGISINKTIVLQDSIFNLLSILFLGFTFFIGKINIYTCIALILIYVCYIYFVFKYRKLVSNYSDEEFVSNDIEKPKSILSDILLLRLFSIFNYKVNRFSSLFVLIISISVIAVSCHFLTVTCRELSHLYGVNLFFISFFIAAIASSIPDTFLSIYDAKKNKIDDAFSNAFGSNIFDICIGLGLPLLIYIILNGDLSIAETSSFDPSILYTSILCLFILSIVSSIIYYLGNMTKLKAILYMVLYLLFIHFVLNI